jgi:hypothetical protein
VHPSPRETFGVVTLEALASGLPVVATQSGGISAILEDERLGELVPPQDPRMLARAVLRTLARRHEFDPHTLRNAVQPFSGDAVAARLSTLYEAVIHEADGGRPTPTAGQAVDWAGRATPVGASVVVLANDADRAARALSRMPAELLSRMALVTHDEPVNEHLPPGIGRVVLTRPHVQDELGRRGLLGPRGPLRERLLRFAANPVAPIRRRLMKGGTAELRWQAGVVAVRRAVSELLLDGDGGPTPEVVCLDVLDYAIAASLVAAGRLRAGPGGLLWLADRWGATHTDDALSRDPAEVAVSGPASPSPVG